MSESKFDTLSIRREGSVLFVDLARPEVRNAFDATLLAELQRCLDVAAEDAFLRCLVLGGQGPVFSAGADLNWMRAAAEGTEDENRADARRMAELFHTLDRLPCATVARIQGAALGGGVGLASCVDVAIAAEDAKFGFTEVRLGIIPAVISAFVLRKIHRGAARRYFVTGEIFDGRRAEALGLISEAVPADALDARVGAVIEQILAVGPAATRAAKALVDEVADAPYPEVLDRLAGRIATLRATDEAREGMAAFLEKRAPTWKEPRP